LIVSLLIVTVVWFGVSPASGAASGPQPTDTNPPTGTIMYPKAASWTSNGYIYIGARFVDPDGIAVSSLSLTVDGFPVAVAWNNPMMYGTVLALPDGSHAVEARASDLAGNGPTILSWSFSVDTVPPVVTISRPLGNPELVNGSATLAWTGSDDASGIKGYNVRLDSGWAIDVGMTTSFSFPDLAPGVHYFQVGAADAAGNIVYKETMATVPFPPANSTTRITVVMPDQIPSWAIVLVVINAIEAAGVAWLALRRKSEPPRGERPSP
jgi:hypothetical protein